jgi:hypothetical protein
MEVEKVFIARKIEFWRYIMNDIPLLFWKLALTRTSNVIDPKSFAWIVDIMVISYSQSWCQAAARIGFDDGNENYAECVPRGCRLVMVIEQSLL